MGKKPSGIICYLCPSHNCETKHHIPTQGCSHDRPQLEDPSRAAAIGPEPNLPKGLTEGVGRKKGAKVARFCASVRDHFERFHPNDLLPPPS